MTPREIKQLCKDIAELNARGEITRQQAKTLQGLAKHGDAAAVIKGLITISRQS